MSAHLNERGLIEADEWTATLSQFGLILIDGLKWGVGVLQLPSYPPRCNPPPNPPPAPREMDNWLAGFFNASIRK